MKEGDRLRRLEPWRGLVVAREELRLSRRREAIGHREVEGAITDIHQAAVTSWLIALTLALAGLLMGSSALPAVADSPDYLSWIPVVGHGIMTLGVEEPPVIGSWMHSAIPEVRLRTGNLQVDTRWDSKDRHGEWWYYTSGFSARSEWQDQADPAGHKARGRLRCFVINPNSPKGAGVEA